jgi:hypothetical protein
MRRLLAALLLALLPPAARAGGEAAVAALRQDRSPKVRTQAALVLGQHGSPEAVAALREAVARDPAAAVRLAATSALGRLQARAARRTLEAAAQADPDPAVQSGAARALLGLGPVTVTVEEPAGPSGPRLAEALGRGLRERGLLPGPGGELRLRPRVEVEVTEAGGATRFVARASVAVVDLDSRLELLERQARASVPGPVPAALRPAHVDRVVEAAARGLVEDLAVRLGRR